MSVQRNEVSYNLAGVVRNMSLPVAGTTVVLYDYWSSGSRLVRHYLTEKVTGAKGDFGFDVRKGIYCVEVIPGGDTRFARQVVEALKVTENKTFSITLKTGHVVSGRIKNAAGEPVTNCEVLIFGIEPSAIRAIEKVDSRGAFSVAVAPGRYYIGCRSVAVEDRRGSRSAPVPYLAPCFQVIDVERDYKHDIVLPELVTFGGIINSDEGHPVGGCKVYVVPSAPQEDTILQPDDAMAVCWSDKTGQFGCDVAPGFYEVKIEPGPQSHLSERTLSSILVDQSRTKTYALGRGYRFFGRVTHAGQPVECALVTVIGGKINSSIMTEEDGTFAFSLSGGTYEVNVYSQPDSLARLPYRLLAPHMVTVNLAEDTEYNVELEGGVAIRGRVIDADNETRPGVQLSLYRDRNGQLDTTNTVDRPVSLGITGDDGSYEFRVMPGRYWLVMNNQKATAQLVEAVGEQVKSDLTWQGTCVLTFEVVSEFDEPVPNCRISCDSYSGGGSNGDRQESDALAVTGSNGSAEVTVTSGIYSFRFDPPELGSYHPKLIRQLSVNGDLHRKVKLAFKQTESLQNS